MHTVYSDGTATHSEIAQAALDAGIDVILVTDHNILVKDLEHYYQKGNRRVLCLIGEEVHDQTRLPQKCHLLVFGNREELSQYANNSQQLIYKAKEMGALTIIAHPFEVSLPIFNEEDISWTDWNVRGFDGIELWNYLSELKLRIRNRLDAVVYGFFPELFSLGPDQRTIQKWDNLTSKNNRVVAIGGSDAHALNVSLGPFHRTIYPYEFHFRTLNTHILVPGPLSGSFKDDADLVFQALRSGHAFIGYDLPYPTKGFRFNATGINKKAIMGDEISLDGGVTLQITLPKRSTCILFHNGEKIKKWEHQDHCVFIVSKPGVYRVEIKIKYLGRVRSWIYSNPIYIA
jgi:hypothetical protein